MVYQSDIKTSRGNKINVKTKLKLEQRNNRNNKEKLINVKDNYKRVKIRKKFEQKVVSSVKEFISSYIIRV